MRLCRKTCQQKFRSLPGQGRRSPGGKRKLLRPAGVPSQPGKVAVTVFLPLWAVTMTWSGTPSPLLSRTLT
jgi:hypothetical protein